MNAAWSRVPLDRVHALAREIQSDGCSGVIDFYWTCCVLHDYAYRTGRDPVTQRPLTRAQADWRFHECIAGRSRVGRWSPMAWWRWIGVRLLGGSSWKGGDRP